MMDTKQIVSRLRYQGKQYSNGNFARGGSGEKHWLEEVAEVIENLEAERDALQKDIEGLLNDTQSLANELHRTELERDALKARIDQKQEPIAWRAYDRKGWWIIGSTKQDALDKCGRGDDRRCEPLYAAPISSPDTQEAIRKAVEEEREACAKVLQAIADDHYFEERFISARTVEECIYAIRSRSTKENSK